MNVVHDEPLATVTGITALASAVIALLLAYGFDISEDQQAAWLTIVAIVAPIVVGVVARFRVSPSWKVPAPKPETTD